MSLAEKLGLGARLGGEGGGLGGGLGDGLGPRSPPATSPRGDGFGHRSPPDTSETAADPFASVVAGVTASMTKGDLTPAARASNPPVESGFAPPNPQAAVAAHTSALAASGALDSDAFTRRHQALSSSVEARTLVVKKQLHALARLQGEIGALTGPSVVSVEDMRKSLSVLSMEVEAARQAFEAARKAKAAADDKVQGQAAMKEALIERLTQIVAQNEAAKMSKLTELLGSLDNLDVDIDPEAVAKVAKAAADAVRRGGSAASSDVRVPLGREEDPIAARAKALKELGEQAAPAFEGF